MSIIWFDTFPLQKKKMKKQELSKCKKLCRYEVQYCPTSIPDETSGSSQWHSQLPASYYVAYWHTPQGRPHTVPVVTRPGCFQHHLNIACKSGRILLRDVRGWRSRFWRVGSCEVKNDFAEWRSNGCHVAVGYWGYSFGVTKARNVDRNVQIQLCYKCQWNCCSMSYSHKSRRKPGNWT